MDLGETWLRDLRDVMHGERVTVTDVRVGVFYTAAELSTGHVGVAFTPRDQSDTVCCPSSASKAPPAGRLAGQDAWTLAQEISAAAPLRRAVGVAVLNSLSAWAMARHGVPGGHVLPGADALDVAGVRPDDRVAMVGAFVPFIKALKGRVAGLTVIDKHREALKPDEALFWRAPADAVETIAGATVVLITGSALVEGGLDALLSAAGSARRVVLAGPTASLWPPTFFRAGVHVLGGVRVVRSADMLRLVSEAGSGYFFGGAAEKVCTVPADGAA